MAEETKQVQAAADGLERSNKITAHFEQNGVIVGSFYRTHLKLRTVKTSDAPDFKIPEGEDVTATAKMNAFKEFLENNAVRWGIRVDKTDRRDDKLKYPGSYTKELLEETADKVLNEKLMEGSITGVQAIVDKTVEAGLLAPKSVIAVTSEGKNTVVTEAYGNGKLKYATVTYDLKFSIGANSMNAKVDVELVSGQLKKPTKLGEIPFTTLGLKNALIDANVLPKIVKEEKAAKVADAPAEGTEATEPAAK